MPHIDPSIRPTYSSSQIAQYVDRISLPAKYRSSPILTKPSPTNSAANEPDALVLLEKFIRYQIAAVPFENLELHYSTHHTITLDPAHLFDKMISRGAGRGGYCMENTCLLGTVLRSLGYRVVTTGARVNEAVQPVAASPDWTGPRFDGWNHMVLLVTIAGTQYLVDVGFGSNSPTIPVPLQDGYTAVNIDPGHSLRLKHGHIADNTSKSPNQDLWIYDIRFNDNAPWLPAYCFSEVEFLPNDFETMNFFVSQNPSSWFTFHVVCLNYVMDPESERIVGDVTLFNNEIKRRRHGVSEHLMEIHAEEDRVLALQKYLGVTLTVAESDGIKGMKSCLSQQNGM